MWNNCGDFFNKFSFDIGKLLNMRMDICGLGIFSCICGFVVLVGWYFFIKIREEGLEEGVVIY